MSEVNIKKDKYNIIKPFIKGDKKLKEIELESGISYATLKRWVKSYKDKGLKGLNKKERKDKNQYKNLNNKTLKLIKDLYNENPSLKISNLYNKFSTIINKTNENEVSYQMLYRVISNLDSFTQSHAELHINRAKFENQIYRSDYIEISNFKENINFFIYFCYDVASFKILHYRISEFKFSFEHYLAFLRETILRNGSTDLPKEFIIGNSQFTDKARIKTIKDELNIEIHSSYNTFKEIGELLNYIYDDISKIIDFSEKNCFFQDIKTLLDSYIIKKPNEVLHNNTLNILLQSKERNVQSYGVRFNNSIYFSKNFKNILREKVTVYYTPFDYSHLYVYFSNKYICTAYLK